MINPDITMKEKRETLVNDRKVMVTYLSHAEASANDDRGGRFAVRSPTTVIGAAPIAYPKQPEGSPWACDPMPPEPLIDGTGEGLTLGYAIDRPDAPAAPEPGGDGGWKRRGWRRL
jgi:hypothetical protein